MLPLTDEDLELSLDHVRQHSIFFVPDGEGDFDGGHDFVVNCFPLADEPPTLEELQAALDLRDATEYKGD